MSWHTPGSTGSSTTSSHNNSCKPVADCIPRRNLCRLRFGLHVEGESVRLAASGHHLVHGRHCSLLCGYRSTRGIRPEDEVAGEGHTSSGSGDGGLNMQVTEVRIRPANEDF